MFSAFHGDPQRCAACGLAPSEGLVVDHDHDTGLVRGLLCRQCNLLEPHAGRDERLGRYRDRSPASMVGLIRRYWSPFTGEDMGDNARRGDIFANTAVPDSDA